MKAVGFGLSSSASVVADSFLVCFKLPLQVYSLVLAFALFGFGFGLLGCLLFLASFGLSGWFPLLPKLGFRLGFSGSGVYLNLQRQSLAFVRCRFPPLWLPALLGWRFGQGLGFCCVFGLVAFVLAASACKLGLAVRVVLCGALAVSKPFVSAPVVKSGHRWVWRSLHIGANRSVLLGGGWALVGIARPNKSVKGTRRPLAVLKFGFYQGSVASLKSCRRRAPYRNVRQSFLKISGSGLPPSSPVVAGNF